MKAIVLAGGFGTRLREKVPNIPKPMAPVAGRPFLEYILDRLVAGGIAEIILSVGYRANTIIDHFSETYRGVTVNYAIETEPLGTGGAIVHALHESSNAPVLILNGDTFLNIDFEELIHWYKENPVPIAMVLKKVPDTSRYGSVLLSGEKVVGFEEKGKCGPGLINAGVYIVQANVFKKLGFSGKFSFETEFLQKQCAVLATRAFITDAYFIDIGIPEDYERAQFELPTVI